MPVLYIRTDELPTVYGVYSNGMDYDVKINTLYSYSDKLLVSESVMIKSVVHWVTVKKTK